MNLFWRDPLTHRLAVPPLPQLVFTHIFGWTQGARERDERGFSTWR